jgi:hypothetical protein
MHIMRIITRLPGGLLRCAIGLAAAAVAVIGLTGRRKREASTADAARKKEMP